MQKITKDFRNGGPAKSKNLGEMIRRLREQSGLKQHELAAMAGITNAHLGQIERGERSPLLATLQKLTYALNVTLDFVVNGGSVSNNGKDPTATELIKTGKYLIATGRLKGMKK